MPALPPGENHCKSRLRRGVSCGGQAIQVATSYLSMDKLSQAGWAALRLGGYDPDRAARGRRSMLIASALRTCPARFGSHGPAIPHHAYRGRAVGIAQGRCRMRQTGTVKFYNSQKGYGFIKPDDGGNDVFVHVTAVERSSIGELTEGMRITFDTEPDKRGKGPKAVDLQQAT